MASTTSVAVITCTIGRPHLQRAIESIEAQKHTNVKHYIVADGLMHHDDYLALRAKHAGPNRIFAYWPTKIGGINWEARRLWSALAPLINEDTACFLNDDDWYREDHLEGLVYLIDQGFDWAYALRGIYDKDGTFLFNDECESLGELHTVWDRPHENFIEQNSVLLRTHCYRAIAPFFCQYGFGNDRITYHQLKRLYPRFAGIANHSMCFRLDGNPMSVTKTYFETGNADMLQRYNGTLPWKRQA